MIIKFTNYADGVHYIDFDEPARKIGLSEPFDGNVKVNVKMDKSHHQIVLDGTFTVHAHLNCDRCAEDFEKEITDSFRLTYLFGEKPEEDETLNLYYISPESDKINIDADVTDFAHLAVPMKKLCDEECKGLCPKCGTNLNKGECTCASEEINPIWAPLQKLKDKSK